MFVAWELGFEGRGRWEISRDRRKDDPGGRNGVGKGLGKSRSLVAER